MGRSLSHSSRQGPRHGQSHRSRCRSRSLSPRLSRRSQSLGLAYSPRHCPSPWQSRSPRSHGRRHGPSQSQRRSSRSQRQWRSRCPCHSPRSRSQCFGRSHRRSRRLGQSQWEGGFSPTEPLFLRQQLPIKDVDRLRLPLPIPNTDVLGDHPITVVKGVRHHKTAVRTVDCVDLRDELAVVVVGLHASNLRRTDTVRLTFPDLGECQWQYSSHHGKISCRAAEGFRECQWDCATHPKPTHQTHHDR